MTALHGNEIMAAAKPRTLTAVMELSAKARKLLDPASRRAVVNGSLRDAGLDWVDAYLHLRFDPAYARAFLGYATTKSTAWRKKRWGVTEPLVWTGKMRRSIYENHRVDVTGLNHPTLRIRLGRVWPKVVHRTLTVIPPREIAFVASAWRRRMALALNDARPASLYTSGPKKGQPKKLTIVGLSSPGVTPSDVNQRNDQFVIRRRRERLDLARAAESELAGSVGDRSAAVGRARQHTWNKWRRAAGGAAGPTHGQEMAGETMSRTYADSSRFKNAERQRAA